MAYSSGNQFFEGILKKALGKSVKLKETTFKAGGCINNTLKLVTSEGDFFLKWQTGIPEDMFQREAEGLGMLANTKCVKIPEVLAYGKMDSKHYLLMEHIDSVPPKSDYWEHYGEMLAKMHQMNTAEKYGLGYDNYIGKLHQPNTEDHSWIDFFIEQRLEFQLKLAVRNRLVSSEFVNRYRNFYNLLPDLLPVDQPALLHGDMWSGNVMVCENGKVCLIDPAVYYGHREIEIAFTQMFGGFDRSFYEAYQNAYPLEPGFNERVAIYNIYPHMVHVNLFGTSYLGGVEQVLRSYL